MLRQLLLWLLRALFGVRQTPTTPPGPPPQEPASPPEAEDRQPATPAPAGPAAPEAETPQPTPSSGPVSPQPAPPPEPEAPTSPPQPRPSVSQWPPPAKTVVPLLVFPRLTGDEVFNQAVQLGNSTYYMSTPWEVDQSKIDEAIGSAEEWLAGALGQRIKWSSTRMVDSRRTLAEWRTFQVSLVKEEVQELGLEWSDDYIYLAFVRGMGGYAGGVRYRNDSAGYAMVGDICLEAICGYAFPTAGSVLLGQQGWQANSYSLTGQTGAFIHEVLHGLDLPHPDGWPQDNQPGWDETLMGHWWNMPNFRNTRGLTQREVERVLRWTMSAPHDHSPT